MTDTADAMEIGELQETGETDETVSNAKRRASRKRSVFVYRGSYEMADGHTDASLGRKLKTDN